MDVQMLTIVSGSVLAVTVAGYLIWTRFKKSHKKVYPRETVIHHQIGRGPYAPSMTPCAVKLETYLRMADIPYLNVHDGKMSKKNKLTWIEYNGEEIADSELCIEYLNKKLDIDLNRNISPRDKSAARAFQKMIEENTYWTVVIDRWLYDEKRSALKVFKIPLVLGFLIRRKIKQMVYAVGMGRHSQKEVYHIMDLDLKALSNFIGDNKYLLGDSPCQEDCAIFGLLSQCYYYAFGSTTETTIKGYTNLCDYCERMKERFWPDWEQCITKGGTVTATKKRNN